MEYFIYLRFHLERAEYISERGVKRMIKSSISTYSKLIILVLIFVSLLSLNISNHQLIPSKAVSDVFTEDFIFDNYQNDTMTNTTEWETGVISNPRKQIINVSSYIPEKHVESVYVSGNYAYITNLEEGLEIINISNPSNPIFIADYKTGDQFHDAIIEGDLAFIAASSFTSFQIVNISNPSNPTFLSGISSSQGIGRITIFGDYAFLTVGGNGIRIVDISNPRSPSLIRTFDTYGYAYEVAIEGDYAYVADSSGGLSILDVSDPANPSFITNYTMSGVQPVQANGVWISGDLAFVSCYLAGVHIVNISNPANPTFVAKYSRYGAAHDVFIEGNNLYLANFHLGVSFVDITDPYNPIGVGRYDTYDASEIFVEGEYIYLADELGGLQIAKIGDIKSLSKVGSVDTPGYAESVDLDGDYAYVADVGEGLQIINMNDPTSPVLVGNYDTVSGARDVKVSGKYAYLAVSLEGLVIVNITDRSAPTFVASCDPPSSLSAEGVDLSGDYAYVADEGGGLMVVNISDPTAPIYAGRYDTSGNAMDVDIVGDLAFIAGGTSGLQILNISDPTSPSFLGSYDTGNAWGVHIAADYAYVADSSGLQIVNINDPRNPILLGNFTISATAFGVQVVGDIAYVGFGSNGIYMLNVSDPTNPSELDHFSIASAIGLKVSGDYAYVGCSSQGLQIFEIMWHRTRQFVSLSFAQSLTIFNVTTNERLIVSATVSATSLLPGGTSIDYYLSADNGQHWEQVTVGIDHTFTYPGFELLWSAELKTTFPLHTPELHTLSISYKHIIGISPVLSSPLDHFLMNDSTPIFIWQGITGVTSYEIQIDTNSEFTSENLISVRVTDSTNYQSSELNDGTWYWRVAGADSSDGDVGFFSAYYMLSIDTLAPSLDQPPDIVYQVGSTGYDIQWTPTDNHPNNYIIYKDDTNIESDSWSSNVQITINVDDLTIGSFTYVIFITDTYGNSAFDTVTVSVTEKTTTTTTTPTSTTTTTSTTTPSWRVLLLLLNLMAIVSLKKWKMKS